MPETIGLAEQQPPPSPHLDADRASWLKDRLADLVEMAVAIHAVKSRMVGADEDMAAHALAGAVHGQAREIARTLGLACGENLEPRAGDWPGVRIGSRIRGHL